MVELYRQKYETVIITRLSWFTVPYCQYGTFRSIFDGGWRKYPLEKIGSRITLVITDNLTRNQGRTIKKERL